jgi:hypothetical protein
MSKTPIETNTLNAIEKIDDLYRAKELLTVFYNAVITEIATKRANLISPDDFVRLKALIEKNLL